MSQTNLTRKDASKFKVGDIVKWIGFGEIPDKRLRCKKTLIISAVSHRNGDIGFKEDSLWWHPENFELAKSQIINNILNDL